MTSMSSLPRLLPRPFKSKVSRSPGRPPPSPNPTPKLQKRRPIRPSASILPASILNKPMIRLKPLPTHIAMMMRRRQLASERRAVKIQLLLEQLKDVRLEADFEKSVLSDSDSGARKWDGTWDGMKETIDSINRARGREAKRAAMKPSEELIARVKELRRKRNDYWTRRAKGRKQDINEGYCSD